MKTLLIVRKINQDGFKNKFRVVELSIDVYAFIQLMLIPQSEFFKFYLANFVPVKRYRNYVLIYASMSFSRETLKSITNIFQSEAFSEGKKEGIEKTCHLLYDVILQPKISEERLIKATKLALFMAKDIE
jgi:hypothetical protein